MKNSFSRNFTLIELLVVIALVLGLLSLLQPSLKSIISSSNTLKCSNNLRNAGVANALYADDFEGFYAPQWHASSSSPISSFKTRWGHLKEFRAYAEWDLGTPSYWMMPQDKACPNAVVKTADKLEEGSHAYFSDPSVIKVFYTYGHLFIGGNKSYRGMHRSWLKSPSQLGNVGEGWQLTRVYYTNFDPRHDFRSNILFFDGHTELFETAELESYQNKPWVDSDGLNLTNINQINSPF
jgi:prepilin-type processing-associated H-X9-DG protein